MSKTNSDLFPTPNLIKPKEPRCSINFNAQWWEDYVPSPDNVIHALIDNGYNCSSYKLFDRNIIALDALKKINVNIIVAFNNWELDKIINENNFIDDEIKIILPYKSIIKTIAVGNEPLGSWYNGEFNNLLVPAIKKVSTTLKKIMPGKDITVPFNFAIFDNTYPPSNSIILPSIYNIVFDSISTIKNHSNNPRLMINIYPYLTYIQNNKININFALGHNSLYYVRDNEYLYTSLFDLMYDAALVAIRKVGFDLPIDIGEIGWPNDGGPSADTQYECNALSQLHVSSTIGTPRQSGPINIYYFEAIDEPWKETGPGIFERHWGILNIDLQPKCPSFNIIYKNIHFKQNTINSLWLLSLIPLILFLPCLIIKKNIKNKKTFYTKNKNNYKTIYNNALTI